METSQVLKTYAGWINLESDIEDGPDDLLYIKRDIEDGPDDLLYIKHNYDPLVKFVQQDIENYGRYLSVQYYTSDTMLNEEDLQTEWTNTIIGLGSSEYTVHWSEITGYLWTDEELKVGGHDLLEELKSYNGKYLHLIIGYSQIIAGTGKQ